MGAVERSRIEEHAQRLLLRGGRPDRDAPRWRASQLDSQVTDRVEREGLESGPRSSVDAVPGDDEPAAREEHRRTDPTEDDEELLVLVDRRIRRALDLRALGRGTRGVGAPRSSIGPWQQLAGPPVGLDAAIAASRRWRGAG
jgi:hypothetical protein